jgi:hypothetical protein
MYVQIQLVSFSYLYESPLLEKYCKTQFTVNLVCMKLAFILLFTDYLRGPRCGHPCCKVFIYTYCTPTHLYMHNDFNTLQLNFMLAVYIKCNSILVCIVTR